MGAEKFSHFYKWLRYWTVKYPGNNETQHSYPRIHMNIFLRTVLVLLIFKSSPKTVEKNGSSVPFFESLRFQYSMIYVFQVDFSKRGIIVNWTWIYSLYHMNTSRCTEGLSSRRKSGKMVVSIYVLRKGAWKGSVSSEAFCRVDWHLMRIMMSILCG